MMLTSGDGETEAKEAASLSGAKTCMSKKVIHS